MKLKRTLIAVTALLFATTTQMSLTACSKKGSENEPQNKSVQEAPKSDVRALETRAQARWDAILKGEYAGAYALETPAYRSINDLVHFQLQFAGQVHRESVRVEKVLIDPAEDGIATVVMKLDFKTMVANQLIDSTSYPRETWVKRDGQWWHLSKQ